MRRALTLLLFLVVAGPLTAQERTHAITPADYATLATVTELAVSPDGKRVAYTEARWDKAEDNRRTDLWVVATDGKTSPRRLTGDRAGDHSPKWSVDGEAVLVQANRKRAGETKPPYDGTAQVWRVKLVPVLGAEIADREGAEPQPVTRVPGGIAAFDYAPLANAVFYTVEKTTSDDDEFSKLREKFAKPDYGHGRRKVTELYRLDLGTWRTEKLFDEGRYIREFAVTRDGKRVAMITAPDDTVIRSEGDSRVDVWENGKVTTTDQSWKKSAASPHPWLESLAWNPSGDKLAYCTIFDGYPAEVIVCERRDRAWLASRVKRTNWQVRGYGSPLVWKSADLVTCLTDDRGNTGFIEKGTSEGVSGLLQMGGQQVYYTFDYLPKDSGPRSGNRVAVMGTPTGFAELGVFDVDPKVRDKLAKLRPGVGDDVLPTHFSPLTDLNPHTKTWKLPTVQQVTWTAPDGTKVGGPLELPYGWKKGDKPLPLIVAIHGGPTTASHNNLEFDPHNGRLYFAAAGYAVLLPNYRGSTGYGDKFVTDLLGNENDLDVKDIVAGIQHLIKEGIADPERIGVMGWSNGGYLTNCLITMKDCPVKIKAASSGAGIIDCVAEWGFNDEPAYPWVFKKGHPWETPDDYHRVSPTYGLGNVKTPTLIHVGGNDERCPPGHSRMLYRALKEYVKVPTELVVYPGEPHGLTKYSNRLAKMEWDLAWFEKYLKK